MSGSYISAKIGEIRGTVADPMLQHVEPSRMESLYRDSALWGAVARPAESAGIGSPGWLQWLQLRPVRRPFMSNIKPHHQSACWSCSEESL